MYTVTVTATNTHGDQDTREYRGSIAGCEQFITDQERLANRMNYTGFTASEIVADAYEVGDGATERLHTDAHAYTVIAVKNGGRMIVLQRDTATLDPTFKPEIIPGGFAGHCTNQADQRWTYQPDPDGAIITARLTKYGWKTPGSDRGNITPGRNERYDWNF